MAKQKNKSTEQAPTNQNQPMVEKPIMGLNLGSLGEDIPEHTLTYALNCINESTDGKMMIISREESNIVTLNFRSEKSANLLNVCGYIKGEDNIVYYFLCNLEGTESEIGYVDKEEVYHTVVNDSGLNFRLYNPIQGVYRLRLGCEPTIYWTEQNCGNPIRYFNFNRLSDFQDSFGNWDINSFSLFYSYTKPNIENVEVLNTGGSWRAGSYNVSIQLVDENFNATPWLFTTSPVPVYHDSLITPARNLLGSSQYDVDNLGGTNYLTTKSIKVSVNNLDDSFPFYRLCLIEASSFNGEVTAIHASNYIPTSQLEYIFTGNNETDFSVTEEDLKVDKIPFRAEVLKQQDNRLLAANLKGVPYELCDFQQYASKIATGYIVKEGSDIHTDSPTNFNNPNTYFLGQGFLGFEIYALGIVYVFPDFETPAYHIPGRPINKYYNIDTNTVTTISGEDDKMPYNFGEVLPFTSVLNESQYNALDPTDKRNVNRWQIRDVSNVYSGETLKGYMSYHENKNHIYPDINNCGSGDYWGSDFTGQPLVGTPIRHHRFPSRTKQPHVSIGNNVVRTEALRIKLTNENPPFAGTSIYITVEYKKDGVLQTVFNSGEFLMSEFDQDGIGLIFVDSSQGTDMFTDISVLTIKDFITDDDVSDKFKVEIDIYVYNTALNNNKTRLLGFNISNIEYPHPEIIGHYIVAGVRDENNRTILDSGFFNPLRSQFLTNGVLATGLGLITNKRNFETDKIFSFLGNFQFNKTVKSATHIRVDGYFSTTQNPEIGGFKHNEGALGVDIYILYKICSYTKFENSTGVGEVYPLVTGGSKIFNAVAKDTSYLNPSSAYNLSMGSRTLFHKLTRAFSTMPTNYTNKNSHVAYGTYCVEKPIYPILEDIVYTRTHNNINVATSETDSESVFGGDSIISQWTLLNHGLYYVHGGFWKLIGKVGLIVAGVLAVTAVIITAGVAAPAIVAAIGALSTLAIGLSAMIVGGGLILAGAIGITAETMNLIKNDFKDLHLFKLVEEEELNEELDDLKNITISKYEAYHNELLWNLYIENSDANIELRGEYLGLETITGKIYRSPNYIQHLENKYFLIDEDDPDEKNFKGSEAITPEIYHCNPDFTRRNLQKTYFPLPYTYDCCSSCNEIYKQRIAYSEQSFQEERVDHYRLFNPLNYKDIEGDSGEITDLYVKGKNLFIMCTESVWMAVANFQTQVTEELTTYIGTGDYLAIPPVKMISDGDVKAGCQHRWGTSHAITGTVYVNELEKKIYLLTGEGYPQAINLQGIKGWSEEEIPLKFLQQFPEYPLNNCPHHIFGIGFTSVFDSKYNRYLITKKDYRLIGDYSPLTVYYTGKEGAYYYIQNPPFTVSPGTIIFGQYLNEFTMIWEVVGIDEDNIIVTPITDRGFDAFPDYFENHSWTISYSLYSDSWVSWHSYTPNIYVSNTNNFYSIRNDQKMLYKHNHKNHYGVYYGKYFPHIIEFAFKNPLQNFTWEHLQIHTKAKKFDNLTSQYSENKLAFFDQAIIYNDTQCTGLKNLRIKQSSEGNRNFMSQQILNTIGEINISKAENIWYLNDIRNFVSLYNENFFTKEWSQIAPYYPIDKIVNENVIDQEKVWHELEMLRSKFIKVRLIMNSNKNNQTTQLMTQFGVQFNNPSYR